MKKLPNGYGGISYLGKGRRRPFVVRLTIGTDDRGYPIYQVLGYYETRAKALEALIEYHKMPYNIDARNITLLELLDKTINYNNFKIKTIYRYNNAKNNLKLLHNVPYYRITAVDILDVTKNLTPSMQSNVFSVIRAMDKMARMMNMPIRNIGDQLVNPEYMPTRKNNIFTHDEIKLIWQQKSDNIAQLVLIYLYTGFRRTELINIKKSDVDLTNNTITGGLKTKAGKNRIIPIHPDIQFIINNLMNTDGEYLVSPHKSSTRIYVKFNTLMQSLNLHHIMHETRHTFRTELDNNNVPQTVIDKLMGHSGGVGEQVYTHKTLEQLRAGIESINYLS